MKKSSLLLPLGLALVIGACKVNKQSVQSNIYQEEHRPQFHYSPQKNWMNDPNGMVYFDGEYHLFYQHDNYENVFGNMSWGHAISRDLIHWQEQPKAIVPDSDSLGMIFSGSAVVDKNNSAGFGANSLVAFYTSTSPKQQQSMAYSTDKGRTWTKYKENPVIKNEVGDQIPDDFRDPKVMWHKESQKWIMSLAVKDHVEFWSSKNLKEWTKESEFGQAIGSHDGVWECPDLFELPVDGNTNNKRWILLVSMNPGGPNGGSATQYFIGNFDGKYFTILQTGIRWVDYGTDNYAGVTYSNMENRAIAIGWMSNWQYAGKVPTQPWRGAYTFPRKLSLKTVDNIIFLTSAPVKELDKIVTNTRSMQNVDVKGSYDLPADIKSFKGKLLFQLASEQIEEYSIVLSNDRGEEVVVGFDKQANQYYIDRTKAGKTDFEKGFGKRHIAPRLTKDNHTDVTLLFDAASVELFADNGLTIMTDIFFVNKTLSKISIKSANGLNIKELNYSGIERIWK
ncbi:glycoside hydrolase family 32 protein [Chitinophagaceae bacterium LB-8]|uniref:Glycoside hydrolase family 32 protein n=1 Tax=Paraflavisolibacter caeni TaxID=2982496 RepID=A0A9X2XUP8_9BACT|nr:glycoside hydrolase family 32 protein [Paraflavisolibacter caeni]MCU7548702.1 glycoside hydrolase family 32 protein [Paraflavisolibacter caeni]